jgi:DNA-binding transcriptional MerR regulator
MKRSHLLPAAERKPGGHRTFGDPNLTRLTFTRRCREFCFSIEQVRTLIVCLELRATFRTGVSKAATRPVSELLPFSCAVSYFRSGGAA